MRLGEPLRYQLIELRVIKRAIESALGDKLIVITLLNYSSVLHNENGIGILYSRKPVSYDKAGLVFHKSGHSRLYLYLGA